MVPGAELAEPLSASVALHNVEMFENYWQLDCVSIVLEDSLEVVLRSP